MKGLLILSAFVSFGLFLICVLLYTKILQLKKKYILLRKRKVPASFQLIRSIEAAMIASIESGNLKRYKKYRNIYNDLSPKNTITYFKNQKEA